MGKKRGVRVAGKEARRQGIGRVVGKVRGGARANRAGGGVTRTRPPRPPTTPHTTPLSPVKYPPADGSPQSTAPARVGPLVPIEQARVLYVTSDLSLAQVAKRIGVGSTTVKRKSAKEGWAAQRRAFKVEQVRVLVGQAQEQQIARRLDLLEAVQQLTDTVVKGIEEPDKGWTVGDLTKLVRLEEDLLGGGGQGHVKREGRSGGDPQKPPDQILHLWASTITVADRPPVTVDVKPFALTGPNTTKGKSGG